jgi:hypothetical protein
LAADVHVPVVPPFQVKGAATARVLDTKASATAQHASNRRIFPTMISPRFG